MVGKLTRQRWIFSINTFLEARGQCLYKGRDWTPKFSPYLTGSVCQSLFTPFTVLLPTPPVTVFAPKSASQHLSMQNQVSFFAVCKSDCKATVTGSDCAHQGAQDRWHQSACVSLKSQGVSTQFSGRVRQRAAFCPQGNMLETVIMCIMVSLVFSNLTWCSLYFGMHIYWEGKDNVLSLTVLL